MAKFRVGDICIVISYKDVRYIGAEVTITSEKEYSACDATGEFTWNYNTDCDCLDEPDEYTMTFQEHELKLKTFGGEQKVMELFTNLDWQETFEKELEAV